MDISIVSLVMMGLMTCMTVAGLYQTFPLSSHVDESNGRG
jgi:hypothetical protein